MKKILLIVSFYSFNWALGNNISQVNQAKTKWRFLFWGVLKQFGIFWIEGMRTVLINIKILEMFRIFELGDIKTGWEVYNLKAMELVYRLSIPEWFKFETVPMELKFARFLLL